MPNLAPAQRLTSATCTSTIAAIPSSNANTAIHREYAMTFINFVKLSIIYVKTVHAIRTKEILMTRKNYKHKTKNLPTNPSFCMIAPDQKDVFKDSDASTANSNRS